MDFSLSCGSGLASSDVAFFILGLLGVGLASGVGGWWLLRAARRVLNPLRMEVRARLRRWQWRRQSRALPLVSSEDALCEGAAIRLGGIVEGGAARPAPMSGLPSVACQHALGERSAGALTSGLAASDFTLRLPDGTSVKVRAGAASAERRLRLFDRRPHRWTDERVRDGWFCESRVAPGDALEVVGRLERRVDPDAPRFGDRRPALQWTLVATERGLSLAFATRGAREEAALHARFLGLPRQAR